MSKVFTPGPPSLANDDSMISRKFGREVINYYGGGLLNRFSFLRNDINFIRRAATAPTTQFIALRDLNPLIADPTRLAFFNHEDVKPLIGVDPFGRTDEDKKSTFDSTKPSPLLLFLGLLPDTPKGLDLETTKHGVVNGQPYFALDVTPQGHFAEEAETFLKKAEAKGYSVQTNVRTMTLHPEAGTFFFTFFPFLIKTHI
jgi:NAD+ diphosphatase